MPVHTDYKSMLRSIAKTYCKGEGGKSVKITDGSTVSVCAKGLTVFYATLRKNGWNESKPRPKATSETVEWYLEKKGLKIPEDYKK